MTEAIRKREAWGREVWKSYLFVLPFLSIFGAFIVYPLLSEVYYSFTRYEIGLPPRFVGLKNFLGLLNDSDYRQSVINTLIYVGIGVNVKLGQNVKLVANRLQAHFPGIAAITEPGQAIKVDTSSRLIISTGWIVSILALIVGGIGVTNTMAMSVFERTREIGILRAVGWPVSRIGAMILSEAVGICLFALAVGCALGVLAAQVFVDHSALSGLIAPSYTASTFAWGLAFALGVGVVGALYPTWRAIRLAPIEALRHE